MAFLGCNFFPLMEEYVIMLSWYWLSEYLSYWVCQSCVEDATKNSSSNSIERLWSIHFWPECMFLFQRLAPRNKYHICTVCVNFSEWSDIWWTLISQAVMVLNTCKMFEQLSHGTKWEQMISALFSLYFWTLKCMLNIFCHLDS